ncbi:MAG TPA: hypothetical protein VFA45_08180 [Actinomycetes bacterium]|nr:hypothetical protein [Actinomycetes bacterium]
MLLGGVVSLVEVVVDDDELVDGNVVLVVVVEVVCLVVVVRLARLTVVGAAAALVETGAARLDRGVASRLAWLDGGAEVTVVEEEEEEEVGCRCTAVVVTGRGSAAARCRGLVTKPARLPPTAPMRTAAITEVHRRDSTNRIGLKASSPRPGLP